MSKETNTDMKRDPYRDIYKYGKRKFEGYVTYEKTYEKRHIYMSQETYICLF